MSTQGAGIVIDEGFFSSGVVSIFNLSPEASGLSKVRLKSLNLSSLPVGSKVLSRRNNRIILVFY